jgi:hypothetical protein
MLAYEWDNGFSRFGNQISVCATALAVNDETRLGRYIIKLVRPRVKVPVFLFSLALRLVKLINLDGFRSFPEIFGPIGDFLR